MPGGIKIKEASEPVFPEIDLNVAYRLGGHFWRNQGRPCYIGEAESVPTVISHSGMVGGITYSLIAAQIIRDLYTGRPNPNTEVFGLDR